MDAHNLSFRYMLCDMISIPQQAPNLTELIIEFSKLYSKLHVVMSYDVDVDLARPWIRHEAYQLLSSPTSLAYLLHKWDLGIPLLNSLLINQVCGRRLGLAGFRKDLLPLCDSEHANYITIRDLQLLATEALDRPGSTISLDRRCQTYASDAILVYELRVFPERPQLIDKLRRLSSNNTAVPAVCIIWAMLDGLSVSIRGCDWDISCVTEICCAAIETTCKKLDIEFSVTSDKNGTHVSLRGAITTSAYLEVTDLPGRLSGKEILLVRCLDQPANARELGIVESFLNECIDFASRGIDAVYLWNRFPFPWANQRLTIRPILCCLTNILTLVRPVDRKIPAIIFVLRLGKITPP